MPSKNATKKSNTDDVKQSKVKSVKKVTDESDEEVEVETKTTKVGKAKKVEEHSEEESEGESEFLVITPWVGFMTLLEPHHIAIYRSPWKTEEF